MQVCIPGLEKRAPCFPPLSSVEHITLGEAAAAPPPIKLWHQSKLWLTPACAVCSSQGGLCGAVSLTTGAQPYRNDGPVLLQVSFRPLELWMPGAHCGPRLQTGVGSCQLPASVVQVLCCCSLPALQLLACACQLCCAPVKWFLSCATALTQRHCMLPPSSAVVLKVCAVAKA